MNPDQLFILFLISTLRGIQVFQDVHPCVRFQDTAKFLLVC